MFPARVSVEQYSTPSQAPTAITTRGTAWATKGVVWITCVSMVGSIRNVAASIIRCHGTLVQEVTTGMGQSGECERQNGSIFVYIHLDLLCAFVQAVAKNFFFIAASIFICDFQKRRIKLAEGEGCVLYNGNTSCACPTHSRTNHSDIEDEAEERWLKI